MRLIGAPTSAGAYAPGQERTPTALRDAGLVEALRGNGIGVTDLGDTDTVRWRTDRAAPRAMNAEAVVSGAVQVAEKVRAAVADGSPALVVGGDCTIAVGSVAGATGTGSVGLVYIDQDVDLKTPETTTEGALDWMGVAHLLAVDGTLPSLSGIGPTTPLLTGDHVLFFGHRNVTESERELIDSLGMAEIGCEEVAADPRGAAARALEFAARFDRLVVHIDIDVVDFADAPLAENTRRNVGLELAQLMAALEVLLSAPTWCALTISEINPEHGETDGSTLSGFARDLARAIGRATAGPSGHHL